MATLLPSF